MSVLERWGAADKEVEAVCFVTRNLIPVELAALYNDIDSLHAETSTRLLVIPCDELGVCPTSAPDLDGVRGLPAHFFGLRPSLRRHLTKRYGVRAVVSEAGGRAAPAVLTSLHAEVERASAALCTVEALRRKVEEVVLQDLERTTLLAEFSGPITDARKGLRDALHRYHDAWFGRAGS